MIENKMKHLIYTLLYALFLIVISMDQGLASQPDENPLTAEGQLSSYQIEAEQIAELKLKLYLPKGYRAYEDQFKIKITQPEGFKQQGFQIKPVKEFYDENTKKTKKGVIDSATLAMTFEAPADLSSGEQSLTVEITYQACTATYCLFPTIRKVDIPFLGKAAPRAVSDKSFWQMEFKDVFEQGLLITFLFVFVAGILTSFTPCVFPMIPITIAVLGRHAHLRSKRHNFLLSHVYVLGIALTYALLGILAAVSGQMFGSFISSPWVIGIVCLVFLAMALSLFGLYEIQPPAFLHKKLSGDLHLHGYSAAFVYGSIAGLVASPCVGPVLVGILTYIAQTQNVSLGFWLMFVFALGMGQLFLLVGFSSQATKLLPRSGKWMDLIKKILGIMMLGVCIYYLNMITPLSSLYNKLLSNGAAPTETQTAAAKLWQPYSDQLLKYAQQQGKPTIIDFWADWCTACHELEAKTFSEQLFLSAAQDFILLKFDATNDSPELRALKAKYEIVGLPTIVFIDAKGQWKKDLTVNEFINATDFVQRMNQVHAP